MEIFLPVAIADVFDKVSILEIKMEFIEDVTKKKYIRSELLKIKKILKDKDLLEYMNSSNYKKLKETNKKLWDVCENRRLMERDKSFGNDFIEESRVEYKVNDLRFQIKSKINKHFNSQVTEVKSYEDLTYE